MFLEHTWCFEVVLVSDGARFCTKHLRYNYEENISSVRNFIHYSARSKNHHNHEYYNRCKNFISGFFCGSAERRLLNDLMANYQKLERPVANETEPVKEEDHLLFSLKNKTFNLQGV